MTNIYNEGRLIMAGCLIINDKNEILLLFRSDHKFYETPGGKIRQEEVSDPNSPTIPEIIKSAQRELYEELGDNIEIKKPEYFGKVKLTIPDGRPAIEHKVVVKILSGTPRINEQEQFSRLDWLPIDKLEKYPLSPDLRLLASKIKKYVKKNKL